MKTKLRRKFPCQLISSFLIDKTSGKQNCKSKKSKMKVRNYSYIPDLASEGNFSSTLQKPEKQARSDSSWHAGLTPHQRLYYHQTLGSVRRSRLYMENPNIPKDHLDFILESDYNHSKELFPNRGEMSVQNETLGKKTFRVLRNQKTIPDKVVEKMGHPLKIGGLKEKLSPFNAKQHNSGHHSQFTNNGYSRQPGNGNFFRY